MKLRLFAITVLGFAMVMVSPLLADEVYNNGPINGRVNSWQINFSSLVSDNFTVTGGPDSLAPFPSAHGCVRATHFNRPR